MTYVLALKIVADADTGELESAEVLGRIGEIPDDVEDGLRNG